MNRRIAFASTILSSGLALCFGSPALAQDTEPQAAAEQPVGAGEIIVTARRREERLQDTPVAVTAVNAAMLENKAAVNIGDLTGSAPNLLITNQNSGAAAANLAIRGLTYADVEKSAEPTVGVVVDGVFIGTSTGQFFDFFDIEQIEVLRGPQGTLFGRNTIGGVINIRRSKPTGEFGGKVEVSYGKFDTLATRAVINAPLSSDGSVGIKGFYFHNETDGWYKQAQDGSPRGFSNNENFGAALRVAPAGSGFEGILTVEKQVQKYDPVVASLTRTGEVFCGLIPAEQCNRNNTTDLYTVFGQANVGRYSAPAATLEMNYDTGDITLTSITGWRKSKENQTQDFDGSSVDLYYVRRLQDYEQWSQEFRAAGKIGDSMDYVVGLYYFKSDYYLAQYSRVFAFLPDIDPLIFDTNPQEVNGRTRSIAAFGDFNWAFADRWRLSFGGRFTRDKKSLDNSFGGNLIGAGSDTFKKFTPKVGVDFRPNEETMIYASWSQGFRSGGFSPRAGTAASASQSYRPEVVDSFEIGSKLELFDRKLQFNVAAFYSKYKNLQQNNTLNCPSCATGNETITSNVGSAKIKGLEFDFTARPTPQLTITGSLGLLDSKFKDFIVGGISPVSGAVVPYDYSKNDLIYNPDMTASLAADYTVPTSFGEIIANLTYRYIGRYDQQISLGPISGDLVNGPIIVNGNDPRVRTDKQGLVDASLSTNFTLAGKEAKLTIFGRNLANDRGPTHGFTVGGLWAFGTAREPRTYGATLGFKF